MRVLVSNLMMLAERKRFHDELCKRGYEPVWVEPEQYLKEQEAVALVGDIDGWLDGDDQITESVLKAALPRLKVISKWGTGVDSIDLSAAERLGVPVYRSPGAFAGAVGEITLGYMLCLCRQIVSIDQEVRHGGWPKWQGAELSGQTIGVIGFGAIGQKIGQLAEAFGMFVVFFDPFNQDKKEDPRRVSTVEELATVADFVCLACSLSKDNVYMVDHRFLKLMKSTAYLINVARGPLVHEKALLEALEREEIAGCALDVFETEPLPDESVLKRQANVILGSHNANNSRAAVEAVHGTTLANLDRVLGKNN
ncbi:MAG: NAD(P)-dependent oxidoreductase [Kordiimonas sp.]